MPLCICGGILELIAITTISSTIAGGAVLADALRKPRPGLQVRGETPCPCTKPEQETK